MEFKFNSNIAGYVHDVVIGTQRLRDVDFIYNIINILEKAKCATLDILRLPKTDTIGEHKETIHKYLLILKNDCGCIFRPSLSININHYSDDMLVADFIEDFEKELSDFIIYDYENIPLYYHVTSAYDNLINYAKSIYDGIKHRLGYSEIKKLLSKTTFDEVISKINIIESYMFELVRGAYTKKSIIEVPELIEFNSDKIIRELLYNFKYLDKPSTDLFTIVLDLDKGEFEFVVNNSAKLKKCAIELFSLYGNINKKRLNRKGEDKND